MRITFQVNTKSESKEEIYVQDGLHFTDTTITTKDEAEEFLRAFILGAQTLWPDWAKGGESSFVRLALINENAEVVLRGR
jgi:hypothetical protein